MHDDNSKPDNGYAAEVLLVSTPHFTKNSDGLERRDIGVLAADVIPGFGAKRPGENFLSAAKFGKHGVA